MTLINSTFSSLMGMYPILRTMRRYTILHARTTNAGKRYLKSQMDGIDANLAIKAQRHALLHLWYKPK